MRSISSRVRPDEAVIVMFCCFPVAVSRADTLRMPLASMSKVTSTWGTPRGAGGIPIRWNLPSVRLSRAIGRSPWSTWTSTEVWLSAAVVNTSLHLVGLQRLQLRASQRKHQMLRTRGVRGDEGQVDLGLERRRQLHLGLLRGLLEPL